MSVPTCSKCVERKDLQGPEQPGVLLKKLGVFLGSILVVGGMLWFLLFWFSLHGEVLESVGAFFALIFLTFSIIIASALARGVIIPFVRRNVIGEYLYIFRDDKGDVHCHREVSANGYIAVGPNGEEARHITGHILRIRNGGYARRNACCVLAWDLEKRERTAAPDVSPWTITSWRAKDDLAIVDGEGGVVPDSRTTPLVGETVFDTLVHHGSVYDIISQLATVRTELTDAEKMHEQVRLGWEYEQRERHALIPKSKAFYRLGSIICEVLNLIAVNRKTMGKSQHAKAIRELIELRVGEMGREEVVEHDELVDVWDRKVARTKQILARASGG